MESAVAQQPGQAALQIHTWQTCNLAYQLCFCLEKPCSPADTGSDCQEVGVLEQATQQQRALLL